MSDFIFSSQPKKEGVLSKSLDLIHHRNPPKATEFKGKWGALAVSENHYRGFSAFDDDSHIAVVLGGPLLCFAENDFLNDLHSSKGTAAILDRFRSGKMTWDEDLSGPFACLIIDKENCKATYVTDLLMLVPIYRFEKGNEIVFGSHPDVVARVTKQTDNIDQVSIADFILNHVVTHPYTCYKNIKQAEAGAIHSLALKNGMETKVQVYWEPREEKTDLSIDDFANKLRESLLKDVRTITSGADRVAAFVSSGEDSRSIVCALPKDVKCDGFTYLYENPVDRAITKQVTDTLDINHTVGAQPYHYYLEILSDASALVGSGHQYSHAHMLGFIDEWKLPQYRAVLGGYLSDSLLKGLFSRKHKARGLFSFLPELPRSGETQTRRQNSSLLNDQVLDQIQKRKEERMVKVAKVRPETCHEWFGIWPATMQLTFPNFLATRRLFRSYEPFMGKNSVKTGAKAPLTYKLNRRLFNKTMRPLLTPTKHIFHGDGHLPYQPYWVNMPLVFWDKFKKYSAKAYHAFTFLITRKETPWQRRRAAKTDREWIDAFETYKAGYESLKEAIKDPEARTQLSSRQTQNLLQVLEWIDRNKKNPA